MVRQLPRPTKSSAYASLAQRESISLTRRGLGYRNSHEAPWAMEMHRVSTSLAMRKSEGSITPMVHHLSRDTVAVTD